GALDRAGHGEARPALLTRGLCPRQGIRHTAARMDPRRELQISVIAAAIAYVAVAAFWVGQAPAGNWSNRMFDFIMWNENAPGGYYLPAAHELLDHPGKSCFAGHPGIPLAFVLFAEQRLPHGAARLLGSPLAFTPFVARHTVAVWATAKVTMAV